MTLTHIDLFAGVGGFAAGFDAAGIQTVAHVEIDKQCQQVLRKHWPDHLILSDVCEAGAHNLPKVDIVTLGSPCQNLSLAGKREGLYGEKSILFFEGIRIINELKPQFAIWENVPGALSSNAGRDFQAVLSQMLGADVPMPRSGRWARSGMARSGQRTLAWRVLDSQYFGLAQRRKRVFVVLDLRGERAVQILLEPEGVRRDSPPRREAGQDVAPTIRDRFDSSPRGDGSDPIVAAIAFDLKQITSKANRSRPQSEVVPTINTAGQMMLANAPVTPPLRAAGGVTSMPTLHKNNSDLDFLVAVLRPWEAHFLAFGGNNTSGPIDVATACNAHGGTGRLDFESETFIVKAQADDVYPINTQIATRHNALGERTGLGIGEAGDPGFTLQANHSHAIGTRMGVRRLLPVETEKLQGFDEGWTEGQADSSRYKQMGNAVSVAVTSWIGQRIVRYAELQD
jgi:DNA (cytosine-5)-methyltransferase 1